MPEYTPDQTIRLRMYRLYTRI